MGALLSAIGIGGEGAAAGAGATTAATAGEAAASGAVEGGLASGLAQTAGAETAGGTSALDFGTITKPGLDHVSSASLNDFKPMPSFMDDLGNFGKNFGLEIAKNLIQSTLRDIPGGKTIGTALQRSFDSPAIKNLFTDPHDELSKRDDIIKLLLRQRLGKA